MASLEATRKRLRYALEYPDAYLAQLDARDEEVLQRDRRMLKKYLGQSLGFGFQKRGTGYGGTEQWPFDVATAVNQTGYRRGITKAIKNPFYDDHWRAQAILLLVKVNDILAMLDEIKFEDVH